jgi:hypothetical protein
LEETKVGRDINRHYYTLDELEQTVKRPVVKRLLDLMDFRNSHPAFSGDFELIKTNDDTLHIRRTSGVHTAELIADFNTRKFEIKTTDYE